MASNKGVKLIEYNARFGDPEAINILTLLETDFSMICQDIVNGTLSSVQFKKEASVCKYIVPQGYGSNPKKNVTLEIIPEYCKSSSLYYAAVNLINDKLAATSSRIAAIVAHSSTIDKAEKKCENGLNFVSGDNIYVRHDIGKSELLEKRIKNMEKIR